MESTTHGTKGNIYVRKRSTLEKTWVNTANSSCLGMNLEGWCCAMVCHAKSHHKECGRLHRESGTRIRSRRFARAFTRSDGRSPKTKQPPPSRLRWQFATWHRKYETWANSTKSCTSCADLIIVPKKRFNTNVVQRWQRQSLLHWTLGGHNLSNAWRCFTMHGGVKWRQLGKAPDNNWVR